MRVVPEDATFELARLMQSAALDPTNWEQALNAVNAFVEGQGAVLLTVQARQRIAPASTDLTGMIDDYFARGWYANDRREACLPLLKARGFVFDHEFQSSEEIEHGDYYHDFLARHRRKWFAGIGAAIEGDYWCLALQREPEADAFASNDLERLKLVRGLLANAAGLSTALGRNWIAGLHSALHVMGQPALLFDARAQVLDASDPALPIIGKHIGTDRRVRFRDARQTTAFESMLREALTITGARHGEAVCRLQLDGHWYVCHASSLLHQDNLIATNAAVLVVIKPAPASLEDILKRKFGLTNAEIEVAIAMSAGRSVQAIAEQRQIRTSTVRIQLKSIYSKIGVSSQSQLVAFTRDLAVNHAPTYRLA